MKKGTTFKLSLFTFISALICLLGNSFLYIETLTYITHGLGFLAYLFLIIWISQIILCKIPRFGANIIILFMSIALAIYSIALFTILPENLLTEFFLLFAYAFILLSIISAIILVGRIIFYSPKTVTPPTEVNYWICSCGMKNTGKFCSECGSALKTEDTNETTTE